MIADAARVAGPDKSPAGLCAAEGFVLLQQERVVEYLLPHAREAFGEAAVDLLPFPVILDRSGAAPPQVLVEISHRQRARLPGGVQRVRERAQPRLRRLPPLRLAAQLRGSGRCFGALARRGSVDARQSSAQSMPRWSGES